MRLRAIRPSQATGRARALLERVSHELGMVPNLVRVLASAPAALEGLLALEAALAAGALPRRLREQLALAVAEAHGCGYCVAAHAAIGRSVGLSDEAIADARAATSTDGREAAVLRLARDLVRARGALDDAALARARAAGITDGEVVEVIAHVALGTFASYVNAVARTPIDFPAVARLEQR